jgi:hypothetical protein
MKSTSDAGFERFWTPRQIIAESMIFPRSGELLLNRGFLHEKLLFFDVLRAFAYPFPRAWFLNPRNLDDFGVSDALFVENARKWRFAPSNHLLEWFLDRLRVSNRD